MDILKGSAGIAAAIIIWTLVEYGLGLHTKHFETGLWTGLGALILALALLTRQIIRHSRTNTEASVFRLVLFGSTLSIGASILYGLFLPVYFTSINPAFYDYLEAYVITSSKANVPGAVMARVEAAKAAYQPMNQLLTSAIGGSVIGTIFSFIVTVFLKPRGRAAKTTLPE